MKCPECGAADGLDEIGLRSADETSVKRGQRIWRCQHCETAFSSGMFRTRRASSVIQGEVDQIHKWGMDEYRATERQQVAQNFPDMPVDDMLPEWHKRYGEWKPPRS